MTELPVLVLVGPAGAGKSTLGGLAAALLGSEFVDVDEVAEPFYAEVGWTIDRLVERSAEVGRLAAEREWEPARAHAVTRVVETSPGAVVALGAGHTSFTVAEHREAVRAALARVGEVVLVLPCDDRAATLAELRRRSLATKGTDWVSGGHDFLAEWVDDAGTRSVATTVLVTGDEPPAVSAKRLVAFIRPCADESPLG